jgi:hypothetical protein
MNPEQRRALDYVRRLSRSLEPPLRLAIRRASSTVPPKVLQRLAAALAEGDVDRAVSVLVDHPAVQSAWAGVRHVYADQVVIAARGHTARVSATLSLRLASPTASESLVGAVRSWEASEFAAIRRSVRDGARVVVAEALETGVGPRAAARAIQERIADGGLTAYDRSLVRSFREQLRDDPTRALGRTLRDKRFDKTVGRGPLTAAKRDKMVAAYERKLVAWRSQTFARTSAMQAANDGQRVAWREAIEGGSVSESEVRRYWIVGEDERMCEVCEPIPNLNARGVALDESFSTPAGAFLNPPVHPNCRCTTWTRVERSGFAPAPTPGIFRALAPSRSGE